jgi:hypothetical protein
MTREPVLLLVSFLTSALRLFRLLLLALSLDFVKGSKWREEASKWRETLQAHRTRIMPVSDCERENDEVGCGDADVQWSPSS